MCKCKLTFHIAAHFDHSLVGAKVELVVDLPGVVALGYWLDANDPLVYDVAYLLLEVVVEAVTRVRIHLIECHVDSLRQELRIVL